jgi:tripartite-type tricarboxylate transporter receptor subunit TctC
MGHRPKTVLGKQANLLVLILFALIASAVVEPSSGHAQSYPAQAVRVVVPFAPGGATDVIARLLAQRLTEVMGKSFFVENRGGASGMIGTLAVAKAPPDGYTLLLVASSHPVLASLYPTIAYDPIKDFSPIVLVASTPYFLVVHPSLQIFNLKDLIAYAKKNPGKLNYASAGMGTSQHLGGELLKRVADVDILHVPYRGSGAARGDLLAGRIQFMFDNVAVMLQHASAGELRGLAVTSKARTPLAPNIPTLSESGLPDFELDGWFGLLAPAGTPPEIVRQLNEAVNAMLTDPEYAARFPPLGAVPLGGSPSKFATFINAEWEKWDKIIKEAGIKPD